MKRGKQALAALCAALVCACLLLPPSRAAGDVFFTAVNDTVLPLTSDTMPVWSGGVLYVPYTVFDTGYTGIDLEINCSQDRAGGTVTLFNLRKMLVFDLNRGTAHNELTGESVDAKAITRNGRAYVPVSAVCSFFGLTSSYRSIEQGYLVRIKSNAVVLGDDRFVDAASNTINRRLREYNQSLAGGSVSPAEPDPQPPVSNPPPETSAVVYLGFRCGDASGLEGILDALERSDAVGVFFFTPGQLAQQDSLVRRALGSGHSVGLLAEGTTAREVRSSLAEGSRLLEQVAWARTTLVMAPKALWEGLEAEGWVCWEETVSAVPQTGAGATAHSASVLRALGSRYRSACLTLDGSQTTAQVLPTLLRQLKNHQFVVSTPLETKL